MENNTIKYAEIILKETPVIQMLFHFFGYKMNYDNLNSHNLILNFKEDNTIIDNNYLHLEEDETMIFVPSPNTINTPSWIEKKGNKNRHYIYFNKNDNYSNHTYNLIFKEYFNYKKYNKYIENYEKSIYNNIYYTSDINKENNIDIDEKIVFSIVKIKSNIENNVFLLAYDAQHFTKHQIYLVVKYIFQNRK